MGTLLSTTRGDGVTQVDARRLVDKLWSYCSVLRDDGVSTIEYTEQVTYLLFLKMAHERETRPLAPERIVPAQCSWQRLLDADGDELPRRLRRLVRTWPAAQRAGRERAVPLFRLRRTCGP